MFIETTLLIRDDIVSPVDFGIPVEIRHIILDIPKFTIKSDEQPKPNKIIAHMDSSYGEFSGPIEIHIRGSSSQQFPRIHKDMKIVQHMMMKLMFYTIILKKE